MSSRRITPEERAKVFKALADPTRVEIVDALSEHGPLCGTDLADRLGVSLALLSHHWDVLVDAGLIRKERVGQLRYCTLDPEVLREAVGDWHAVPITGAADRKRGHAPAKRKAKSAAASKRRRRTTP